MRLFLIYICFPFQKRKNGSLRNPWYLRVTHFRFLKKPIFTEPYVVSNVTVLILFSAVEYFRSIWTSIPKEQVMFKTTHLANILIPTSYCTPLYTCDMWLELEKNVAALWCYWHKALRFCFDTHQFYIGAIYEESHSWFPHNLFRLPENWSIKFPQTIGL